MADEQQSDTFPETPDSLKNGNVEGPSEPQNAGRWSERHFQSGDARGNVAQDEAQQEVEDEIAPLRRHQRGNVQGAPNDALGVIDEVAGSQLADEEPRRERAEGEETGETGGLISKLASPHNGWNLLYQQSLKFAAYNS